MIVADDVRRLMKRCQIGVGGNPRQALDEAHSIMADCYGTLGALLIDNARLQDEVSRLKERVEAMGDSR